MITPKAINLNIDFENSTPQYCEFLRGDSIQFNFTFNDTYNATKLRVLCYTKRGEYAFGNEFEDLTKAIFYTNYTAGFSGQAVITVQLLDDEENLVNSANVVCKIIESNTQTPFVVSPDFANKAKAEVRQLIIEGKQEIREATSDAKEEIDGWSDQSTRLANAEAEIKTLSQVKSNRGELWFNGGKLACLNKFQLDAFSCVWTATLNVSDLPTTDNSDWIYTCAHRANNTGFRVGVHQPAENKPANMWLQFYYYDSSDANHYISKKFVTDCYDGKPHTFAVIFTGSLVKFLIDNETKLSATLDYDLVPRDCSYPLTIGAITHKISRIKYFNFDITSEDAPYTIADYIAGKDESPLLSGTLLSLADYTIQRNSTTKVVLDESGNGNVATITGSVAGTNDTAISAFIDELKTQITQSS